QGEQRRDNQNAILAGATHQWCKFLWERRDGRTGLATARICAIAMEEIVLQVAEDQSAGVVHGARSTIRLPSRSTRPRKPGSTTVVASGCSKMAGPPISVSTGRSSRG